MSDLKGLFELCEYKLFVRKITAQLVKFHILVKQTINIMFSLFAVTKVTFIRNFCKKMNIRFNTSIDGMNVSELYEMSSFYREVINPGEKCTES